MANRGRGSSRSTRSGNKNGKSHGKTNGSSDNCDRDKTIMSDGSNTSHDNRKRKRQAHGMTDVDPKKQNSATETHRDSDSGSDHEPRSADVEEMLTFATSSTKEETDIVKAGFHMARSSMRDFVKSCVFKEKKFVSQKDGTAERIIQSGMSKKHVNKFDGVKEDVFVSNCSKMLVSLTNDRRQQVQQKMQKQCLSE